MRKRVAPYTQEDVSITAKRPRNCSYKENLQDFRLGGHHEHSPNVSSS